MRAACFMVNSGSAHHCRPLIRSPNIGSRTYAAAASSLADTQSQPEPRQGRASITTETREHKSNDRPRRSPSPFQRPQTTSDEEEAYILTFTTDAAHHQRMTEIRKKYFPPKLNKLEAHLTLFHALPGSRLDDAVLPIIQRVASQTSPFDIVAARPFRLGKRGVAISVPHDQGGAKAKAVRNQLQNTWKKEGFLSQQDTGKSGRTFPHYTVMNKVDEETEVQRVLQELEHGFEPDHGTVKGLGLFKYHRGRWLWIEEFKFAPDIRNG